MTKSVAVIAIGLLLPSLVWGDMDRQTERWGVRPSIDAGTDLHAADRFGNTPLHSALIHGRYTMVESLLEAGADVNTPNLRGDTPLLLAASNPTMIATLLRYHANPNIAGYRGETPLHKAVETMNPDQRMQAVALLLEAGANINAVNQRDQTPLHLAANRPDLLELMLPYHPNIGLRDFRGRTAVDYALRPQLKAMIQSASEAYSIKPPLTHPPAPSPFSLETAATIETSTDAARITGHITGGGAVTTLTVDGQSVSVSADGSFDFQRLVSIGKTDLLLIAKNEWAQTAEARITVVRTPYASAQTEYAPLNPSRLQGAPHPEAIALIIGIEQYQNAPPADFAEKDARAFYDYAAKSLGVPVDQIKVLSGQNASRLGVQKTLRTWLIPLIAKGRSDVFVYFSGHGLASDDGKDTFLLPYDGDVAMLAESSLRQKDLVDTIRTAGAASVTLMLDTCYSGNARNNATLVPSTRPVMIAAKEQPVQPHVTILAAAANNQLSNVLPSVQHGLFSYFLMQGLEGQAAGADHIITAARLERYLMDHVPVEAAKLGHPQTPQLLGDGERELSKF